MNSVMYALALRCLSNNNNNNIIGRGIGRVPVIYTILYYYISILGIK